MDEEESQKTKITQIIHTRTYVPAMHEGSDPDNTNLPSIRSEGHQLRKYSMLCVVQRETQKRRRKNAEEPPEASSPN